MHHGLSEVLKHFWCFFGVFLTFLFETPVRKEGERRPKITFLYSVLICRLHHSYQDSDIFSSVTVLLCRGSELGSKTNSQATAKAIPPHRRHPTLGRETTGHILVFVPEVFSLLEITVTLHLQPTQNNPKDDTMYRYLKV